MMHTVAAVSDRLVPVSVNSAWGSEERQTLRNRHFVARPERHFKVDFDLWPVPRSNLFPSERPVPAPRRPHDMPPIFSGTQ